MLQPNLEPPDGLTREIRRSPLPFRIGLASTDQRNARSIGMEINILNLQRHQLATTGQRFVRHAEQCPLAISPKANAGTLDKFLNLLPTQGMRLVLACRSLASHLL